MMLVPTVSASGLDSQSFPKVQLDDTELKEVQANMNDLGISADKQKDLIEKVKQGELLDAWNPEKKPVSVSVKNPTTGATISSKDTTNADYLTEGYEVIKTFDDGSVSIQSVEVVPGFGCTGNGWYTACKFMKVSYTDTLVSADFYADFELVNGGYDQITKVYPNDVRITTGGGLPSDVVNTVDRRYETAGQPARALLRFQKNTSDWYSTTYILNLFVGMDRYWSQGW